VAVYFAGNGALVYQGNRLSNRDFLTQVCGETAHIDLNLSCTDIFPVVGVMNRDSFAECRNPVTYKVYDVGQVLGPTLDVLADSWQDLFAGLASSSLKMSLGQASSFSAPYFWSGLDERGNALPNVDRCQDWMSASRFLSGEVGNVQGIQPPFVGVSPHALHVATCQSELTYLCACVGPVLNAH